MERVLETSHQHTGGGVGRVLNGSHVVASIQWGPICTGVGTCVQGASEKDIIDLTISRMENKAKDGMGSVAESKALALLHQAKAELSGGQKTMPDGTPILGATE